MLEESAVFEWVMNQLSSKANSLKMKNRVLELLTPYLESGFVANESRVDQVPILSTIHIIISIW